jgi:hypothetical protein
LLLLQLLLAAAAQQAVAAADAGAGCAADAAAQVRVAGSKGVSKEVQRGGGDASVQVWVRPVPRQLKVRQLRRLLQLVVLLLLELAAAGRWRGVGAARGARRRRRAAGVVQPRVAAASCGAAGCMEEQLCAPIQPVRQRLQAACLCALGALRRLCF